MRETVEREGDKRSVSYGGHFNPNLLKALSSQCQSGLVGFRGRDGCIMPIGASGCVRRAGKNCDWVGSLRVPTFHGETVCLTEE